MAPGFTGNEEIMYMHSLVACLKEKNHKAICLYTTLQEQREVIKKNARSDHRRQNKNLSKDLKTAFNFDEKMAFAPLSGLDEDRPLMYGYVYSGRYVHRMLPTLKELFCVDGAHMKGKMKGTLLSLWGYDANDHLINVALSFVYANEDEKRWTDFLKIVKSWYPSLNTSVWLSDGDKGLAPTMKNVFPSVNHLMCYRHVADNVRKSCGTGIDISLYFII